MSPNFFLRLNISFFSVIGLLLLIFNKYIIKTTFNTTTKNAQILMYMIAIFMISQALYSYIALRTRDKLIKKKIFNVNILLLSALLVIYSYYVIVMDGKHNMMVTILLMFILIANYIALKIFRKNLLYNQNFVIFIQ